MRKEMENASRDELRKVNNIIFELWFSQLCNRYEGRTLGEGARWYLRQRSSA